MHVRTLAPALGAEIVDVNLSELMSDERYKIANKALVDYGVIVAKRQILAPDQFVAFGRRFGNLRPHPLARRRHPDYPEITVLPIPTGEGGAERAKGGSRRDDWLIDLIGWHPDLAYEREMAIITAMLSQEAPESGGDLLFLSTYAIYEALPEALKKKIDGRTGTFCYGGRKAYRAGPTVEGRGKIAIVEHPAVLRHPDTGRKALYLNPALSVGFVGMSQTDADAILDEIFDRHLVRPEWQYRHSWEAGDLVMWDNRCVFHSGTQGYAPEIRHPVWRIWTR